MDLTDYNDIVVSEEEGSGEDFREALERVWFFEEYMRFYIKGREHFVKKIVVFNLYGAPTIWLTMMNKNHSLTSGYLVLWDTYINWWVLFSFSTPRESIVFSFAWNCVMVADLIYTKVIRQFM